MTTFPNASNPKKKNDQIFLQTMQEDMNFKPETEIWKKYKERNNDYLFSWNSNNPFSPCCQTWYLKSQSTTYENKAKKHMIWRYMK